jgi:hypothetical protein
MPHTAIAAVASIVAVQVWWPVIRQPYKPRVPSQEKVWLVAFLSAAMIATGIAGL